MTRRKLNEYENGELSFHGDLKTSQTEMDIQLNMLKHKIIFTVLEPQNHLIWGNINHSMLSAVKHRFVY